MQKPEHDCRDLIDIFHRCFQEKYRVQLIAGAEEPLYQPALNMTDFHSIYFTKDYFSSALHESAHWLIAGPARRLELDYGYWYEPDGRNVEQQMLFQQAEVKPQALECILSMAASFPFKVSLDNLNGTTENTKVFEKAVFEQVKLYQEKGLSARMKRFRDALAEFYQG